ncbi:CHASE3 domain-containing protein [Hydrogenophaga sp.]|uniref:CHASE3 domain-containing protein n=1 Tax=Hydrogenophaga sp. TaxID=1904254 RepID=UPI0027255705|nr:CHASE3 domain-containing protein [Hydrogenophaga sp.]MDO9436061.1 CHASE3 domain-containing protein [Hydrogenophaga sp.]
MPIARPWRTASWRMSLAMALAAILALAVFAGSEWTYQRARDSMFNLGERDTARTAVQTVLRRLLDLETAQRGYLLTGRPQYLVPFEAAETDIGLAIGLLREHHRSDPELLSQVDALQEQVLQKTSEVQATIALYNQGSHTAWQGILSTDIGREMMDNARRIANLLLQTEDRRIAAERANVYRTLNVGRVSVHGLTLLSLLAYVFFLRKNATLQANQLAHALQLQNERDSLEQQVRVRTEELAQLNLSLQQLRDGERSKFARAMHDELGALLTTAQLDLTRLRHALPADGPDVAARLKHLGSTLDQSIDVKRRLMEQLMPAALHNLGLQAAVEERVREFQRRTGVAVELDVPPVDTDESTRQALFSVVQSVLSNVERHANATRVGLSLVAEGGALDLTLTDDGQGFTGQPGSTSALGLKNLRHRVESLGGRFSVRSAPGEGTHVHVRLPLAAPSELRTELPT